ncbi:uncharacterized protein LOC133176731 [Saccostrea echinata]|uniref:uncharacterized protein LOC133176731 n=1 Tax=Saccostrea echinata TaxID=191078 RepID=UPI002A832630|nr:uncharacterized protein LOC133176731 [Saccostrea echinata]
MNEILDYLDDVNEYAKNTSAESTEPSKQGEITQDQQSSLIGVMNLLVDKENDKDIYEVMDFLLFKCCEIADKNHTSDYILREKFTNVSKVLQGSEKSKYRAYLNEDSWNYISSPDVFKENLTDHKIRKKSLPENWDFKSKLLNQEGSITENQAVDNLWVKHDKEKSNFKQGLNEVDAGTNKVCFNVSEGVNLVSHDLPSLRCICKQVLLGPTADTQDVEGLKSPKMVQGNEHYHFELESKDNQRNDCEGKMRFIKYLGLSPSLTLEKETDTENFCCDAEQNAHESLLQPTLIESKSKNYTLNCTEIKQTIREQDNVFELNLPNLQCVSMKTEAFKDQSADMKQGTLLKKTEIQSGLPVDMEQLIPCKRMKLEEKESSMFENHHTDEKPIELHLLVKIASVDDIKEDSNENMLYATVDMKKEKQSLVEYTTRKDIKNKQDILSVGQSESLVPLNFYKEKQLKMKFDEVEKKVSECDKNQSNANLSKVLVSDSIPELRTKDDNKFTFSTEEGCVFKEMQSTEQIVPSTVNKEHTETYERESFYDEENYRCDKFRNLGMKETVLHDEQKDSVHGVFEPNTKCFKWKYTPSYVDDTDAVVPDTEKKGHDLPCRILPILSCKKPIRLGLSRKHHLASLHPYMKKEAKK